MRNAGSAASPVPAEGAGRQRLPAPSPSSQIPCLAPPPRVPPAHLGCCLPPFLAAVLLTALPASRLHQRESPCSAVWARGAESAEISQHVTSRAPSSSEAAICGVPHHGAHTLPWAEWDGNAFPLQAAGGVPWPWSRAIPCLGGGWPRGLDGVREGRSLLEEEGSGCLACSSKICCGVSQT